MLVPSSKSLNEVISGNPFGNFETGKQNASVVPALKTTFIVENVEQHAQSDCGCTTTYKDNCPCASARFHFAHRVQQSPKIAINSIHYNSTAAVAPLKTR